MFRYVVEIDKKGDGNWERVQGLARPKDVNDYIRLTERIRARGDEEIVAGRIVHCRTEKIVKWIKPFKPEPKPDKLPGPQGNIELTGGME